MKPSRSGVTAFVREVLMPGAPDRKVRIDRRYAHFRLAIVRSPIHGHGVVAKEPIPARRRVIEYTGEIITNAEAARRMLRPVLHMFHLDADYQIDGGIGGSGAELVNHSCEPNLVSRVIGRRRVYYLSRRPIEAGEELTVDYRLKPDATPVPCRCGAPTCRGVMNLPTPSDTKKR